MQISLAVYIDCWRPELRDTEYGQKLVRLRNQLAEGPDRPLILILGSSRSELGFRPDALPTVRIGGEQALVFNGALTGSGPVQELLCLKRLLSAGIHPTHVFVEVLPPLLHQEGDWAEEKWLALDRLSLGDIVLLRRYWQEPWSKTLAGSEAWLLPCVSDRFRLMTHFAPSWLTWDVRQDDWSAIDGSGWLPYRRPKVDTEEYGRGQALAFHQYAGGLGQFRITEIPDRALHELLDVCREEGISVSLVLMPEGRAFQSWYPPTVRAEIDRYLAEVQKQYGVALIDARSWMGDNAFCDNHHLLPGAATEFSRRFGREVLQPLVEGKAGWAAGW